MLLRLVQPRLFPYLWALLAALALLIGLAWNARVPATLSGLGLVIRSDGSGVTPPGLVIVSLLPPGGLGELRPGQRVLLRGSDAQT